MTYGIMSPWTAAAVAEFTRLHAARLSFADIAIELQKLGFAIGRNACIGKAKRMGIVNGRRPGNNGKRKSAADRIAALNNATKAAARRIACTPIEAPPPPVKNRTGDLVDLDQDQCRWPIGDRPPFTFCTNDKCGVLNSPYCHDHHERAFVHARPLR